MNDRIGWFGALLLAAGLAQAAPGQVQVTFTIASDKFQKGLKGAVGGVEADLATRLAAHLQTPFPLIDWVGAVPADAPAAKFVATLAQDDLPIPNIQVRWSARIGDTDIPMPQLDAITVYQFRAIERPYRNPGQLTKEIDAALAAWIRTDAVEQNLHDQFVTHVPLATRIDFDTQRQAIVIPLQWQRAKLGDESVFRLEFVRAAPIGNFKVKLSGVSERLSEPLAGNTQCIVSSCTEGGTPVANDAWNTCVKILLDANPPPLSVSVEKYRFDANPGLTGAHGTVVSP